MLLLALLFALAAAQPAQFVLHFGCNFPNNGTHIMGVSITVCGNQPNYIQTIVPSGPCTAGNTFRVIVNTSTVFNTLSLCTVSVNENQLSVSRTFSILGGETYEWRDLTADLVINIEDWNPWCEVSPDTDALAYNGGRLALQVQLPSNSAPGVFRGYSPFRPQCANDGDLRWDFFPRLENGYVFGNTSNPDFCLYNGSFHRPVSVGILRTEYPVNVYADEFKFTGPTPDACLSPRSFTIGRTAVGYPTSIQAPGSFVQYTVDTNCTDGLCNSGLLIARLQVPNRCWEPSYSPTPDQIIGRPLGAQDAYNATNPDGSTTLRSFPMGGMLITWEYPAGGVRNYRYAALAAEALNTFYVLATSNYQVYSQYEVASPSPLVWKAYNASIDHNTVVSGRFVKQPTANCDDGSCEAQPITSTLHINTQGRCNEIDVISIRQQRYNAAFGTYEWAVIDHRPNCSNLPATDDLLYCVWNLDPTQVTIRYRSRGTAGALIPVTLPNIDCQETSQRCDAARGLRLLCPNLGCLTDTMNGPTQLNFATWQDSTVDTLVDYFQASPQAVQSTNNGCWWVPALPNLRVTISEGCCAVNTTTLGDPVFTGFGCVQHNSALVNCSTSAPTCSPSTDFGRTLAAFDLAYLPKDDGISTVSVSLENPTDCGPFRFKTSQGGAPRCYCVLPIELRARIIETNLANTVQACKCTDIESCVVRYPTLEQDCSLCDFASALNFDLSGLPRTVTANLYVGAWSSNTTLPVLPLAGFGVLRNYARGVGGENNRITVLQVGRQASGCTDPQGCARQAYCVEVTENAASLTICVVCDFKTCVAYDFTRDLCLDLRNPCPNGTTTNLFDLVLTTQGREVSLENGLVWNLTRTAPTDVDYLAGQLPQFVRLVRAQGGVDGCATPAIIRKRSEEADVVHQDALADEESLRSLTEEQLIDLELSNTMHNIERDEQNSHKRYVSTPNPGHYTVLRLPNYGVTLFEQSVRVQRNTDCNGTTLNSCTTTSATGLLGYLNCLCWNTTCVGNAVNQTTGINGGSIPSNNIWVTLGGNGQGIFGLDSVAQRQLAFSQVRGPRGYWTQNLTTCEWTKDTWINATWQRVGNQYQCVPVLQSNSYSLTVEEGLLFPPAPIWPDPRGHPLVTVPVNCSFVLPSCVQWPVLDPRCWCHVRSNQVFALWEVINLRPLLSELGSNLVFTYTGENATNYDFSNQNVFRVVPSNAVAWGSARQGTGSGLSQELWNPAYNFFCQVADPRYSFTFTWASTFAYPSQPWPGVNGISWWNASYSFSPFNCFTGTVPVWTERYPWAGGHTYPLNLCRGCQWYRNDTSTTNPSLQTFNPSLPLSGQNQCRFAYVPPGSDFTPSLPLGQIFVWPFSP